MAYVVETWSGTNATNWNAADTGGSWTVVNGGGTMNEGAGLGVMSPNAGATQRANLLSVSQLDTDALLKFAYSDAVNTASGINVYVEGRYVSSSLHYRMRVQFTSANAVRLQLEMNGTAVTNGAFITVARETFVPGAFYWARFEVEGTNPATLRGKIWQDGTSEPADWDIVGTDSTAGVQVAGAPGIRSFTGSNQSPAGEYRYDSLVVDAIGGGGSVVTGDAALSGLATIAAAGTIVSTSPQTVTKYATAGQAAGSPFNGEWTNPQNVGGDDGVYATAAPGKNQEYASVFPIAFATSDVPAGATIQSILIEVQWKVSTTSSIATLQSTLFADSAQATAISATPGVQDTAEPTADTTRSYTATPTEAQIRDLWVRVQALRGNTNTAFTASLDYVRATVTYLAPVPAVTGSAALTGQATFAAAASREVRGTAALAGLATIGATASVEARGTAALSGLATLAATGSREARGTAALSGLATISATASRQVTASPALSALATITAGALVERRASAALAGAATFSAAAVGTITASAALAGLATITATGSTDRLPVTGTAALAGLATLAAAASRDVAAAAPLAGLATVSGAGIVERGGSVALTAFGTLSVTPRIERTGTGALAGLATFSANSAIERRATAALAGLATIDLQIGPLEKLGSAALAGQATFAAAGLVERRSSAALAGAGTIAVTVRIDRTATVAYMGTAALTAGGTLETTAGAALDAFATLFVIATSGPAVRDTMRILHRIVSLLEPAPASLLFGTVVGVLEPTQVELSNTEPFTFEPNTLYAWESADRRSSVASGGAIIRQDFEYLCAFGYADSGEEARMLGGDRELSIALDQKARGYIDTLRQNQQTDEWDSVTPTYDPDYLLAFGIRGFAIRINGYRLL